MNEGISRYTSRFFQNPLGQRKQTASKQDYKARLWNSPVEESRDIDVEEGHDCPYAQQVRDVIGSLENGVAFQSLAVAAMQTLQQVLVCEKRAAEAAISLAQGEKLQGMIETSERTSEAIADALDAQGAHILNMAPADETAEDGDNSWWFALTETMQAMEDGTKRLLSLASGQPKGGPARRLSSVVVRLLRKQHNDLLVEADAWIS